MEGEGYVKEKMKHLKRGIREWNKYGFENIN